jgi:hypothetical protein
LPIQIWTPSGWRDPLRWRPGNKSRLGNKVATVL